MSSRPAPRARGLARLRRSISLLAVGLLSLPLIAWSDAVSVAVDGDVLTARTYAATVGDVLAQLDVPVGPADVVTPAPTATVPDGGTIEVERAITVDVLVDGQVNRRVTALVSSVAGVLTAADLDVREVGGASAPSWNAPVEDGGEVHVTLPTPVTVVVDGDQREVETLTSTVGAMLHDAGIALGDEDAVDWDLDVPLHAHSTVTVERVETDEVTEEVALEHGSERRETDDLPDGETRVEVEGRDGVRTDTYRVERRDGDEVDRELVDREVTREPVDEVVLVGTYVEPEPEPEPAPAPARSSSGGGSGGGGGGSDVWDRLAACESGGNWGHRGGTYHGGLQFHPSTWDAHKPSGAPTYAYEATRDQQIAAGRAVQASQGWGAWPHCAAQLGLR